MDSPVFTEAFAEVVKEGHAHNLSVGSLISDPARIPFMREQGIDYLSLGSDALALRRGLSAQVAAVMTGD
jgi:2-keto-3-deoxy-L-rhamnonate aldolase RhmA